MLRALHIPLDFERSEHVRVFARKLAVHGEQEALLAPLYALRIWMDWGIAGVETRPMRCAMKDTKTPSAHEWDHENVAFVIEDAARWKGKSGAMIVAALESGLITVGVRGDACSLVLTDFWRHNEHLSPDYKTMQQKGGLVGARSRIAKEMGAQARICRELIQQTRQGDLPFGAETSEIMQEKCYALFLRLHRECDLELPSSEKFTAHAMSDALTVVLRYTEEQIAAVENWILLHREDEDFTGTPGRILENFTEYFGKVRV